MSLPEVGKCFGSGEAAEHYTAKKSSVDMRGTAWVCREPEFGHVVFSGMFVFYSPKQCLAIHTSIYTQARDSGESVNSALQSHWGVSVEPEAGRRSWLFAAVL